ncbi:hypothetical protein NL108_015896 [Boleophthalmus pectinirostris]|nr:hypothetical protein NL108_015896 [Boleophthalmus pectinirostris]
MSNISVILVNIFKHLLPAISKKKKKKKKKKSLELISSLWPMKRNIYFSFFHLPSTALPQSNTTQSQHSTVNASIIIAVLAVVCVIILSLAIAFCFYKKWCFFAKPTPALLEEHCYDEIQERPQQLSSETAVQTVYATATLDNVKPGPDSTEDSTDAAFEDNVLYE